MGGLGGVSRVVAEILGWAAAAGVEWVSAAAAECLRGFGSSSDRLRICRGSGRVVKVDEQWLI